MLPPWAAAWSAKLGMAVAVNAGSSEGGDVRGVEGSGLTEGCHIVLYSMRYWGFLGVQDLI